MWQYIPGVSNWANATLRYKIERSVPFWKTSVAPEIFVLNACSTLVFFPIVFWNFFVKKKTFHHFQKFNEKIFVTFFFKKKRNFYLYFSQEKNFSLYFSKKKKFSSYFSHEKNFSLFFSKKKNFLSHFSQEKFFLIFLVKKNL